MSITEVHISRIKKEENSYTRRTAELLVQAEIQEENQYEQLTLYKHVHKNFNRYVNERSGKEFKRTNEIQLGESGLFERFDQAYNDALRATGDYNKGQNLERGYDYIETWRILVFNETNRAVFPDGPYSCYDIHRWDIIEVVKYV
jgi:hypothetical protein